MRSEGELSEDTLEEIHTRVMRMHTLMVEDGEDNFSRGVLLVAEKLRTSIDRPESRSRSFCVDASVPTAWAPPPVSSSCPACT